MERYFRESAEILTQLRFWLIQDFLKIKWEFDRVNAENLGFLSKYFLIAQKLKASFCFSFFIIMVDQYHPSPRHSPWKLRNFKCWPPKLIALVVSMTLVVKFCGLEATWSNFCKKSVRNDYFLFGLSLTFAWVVKNWTWF